MDGFCGCVDNACKTSVCKPFAGEGEVCGGFRMASAVTYCNSNEFTCVAPNFIADIGGRCGASTTVQALLANPTAFNGRYVALTGVVASAFPRCTLMACGPQNPCCNACSAPLALWDNAAQVHTIAGLGLVVDGIPQSCGGNSCDFDDHCSMEQGSYFIGGWFSWDGFSGSLEVTQRYSAPVH